MGGGKAGRKGIVRISTTMMMMMIDQYFAQILLHRIAQQEKIEIKLVAFVIIIIIIILHTLLKVGSQERRYIIQVYTHTFYSLCSRRLTGQLVSNDPAVCRKFIYLHPTLQYMSRRTNLAQFSQIRFVQVSRYRRYQVRFLRALSAVSLYEVWYEGGLPTYKRMNVYLGRVGQVGSLQ